MTSLAVLTETVGHTLIITINRPEARNAINAAVHLGIGEAIERAQNDPEIRVVILTGAGDKAFCAGADLVALSRGEPLMPPDPAKVAWGFGGFVKHVIAKPVIAAVYGFALGGGTELALACDLIVAADTAQFGLPEVKRGIIAGAGGAFRLAQHMPRKLAMEYLLTGELFSALRAQELGLVNRVVPAAELMDAALALAEKIGANAPLSVQASKRIALGIVDGRQLPDDAFWAQSAAEAQAITRSDDAKEGPRAFAEKRPPVWKAR